MTGIPFVDFPMPAGSATEIDGQRITRWVATDRRVIAETDTGKVWYAVRWSDGDIVAWGRTGTHSYERYVRAHGVVKM